MTCATFPLHGHAPCPVRPQRHAPRARRVLARGVIAVALAALAAYGEAWLLHDAPAASPELAGARCVAAFALADTQPLGCTFALQGATP
jgi:hypothetical protein